MHLGLGYMKIAKFRNLGTSIIAIFTPAAHEPAHSNGYDPSFTPTIKKAGWTPLLQKSKPEIHVHALHLRCKQ